LLFAIGTYSTLSPANFTTPAHFSVSAAMSLPKSADVPGINSPPIAPNRDFIAASLKAALISVLSLSTISAGVFVGAAMPYHWLAS
jgi:hypothetical protein